MKENIVKLAIKKVAEKNKIKIDFENPDLTLKDLNVDSLALLNLIFNIENELNVRLKDDELVKIKNLKELISAFEKALK